MLERINETLWTTSPGGQYASLLYGLVTPETGEFEYAAAGRVSALVVHEQGHIVLASGATPLGVDPETSLTRQRHIIPAGGILVLVSDGVLASSDPSGRHWDELALAEFLQRQLHLSADELLARLRQSLGTCVTDRTLLFAKRLR
jgi:serine phosphatase RsbU (regulator of sigma subunit)